MKGGRGAVPETDGTGAVPEADGTGAVPEAEGTGLVVPGVLDGTFADTDGAGVKTDKSGKLTTEEILVGTTAAEVSIRVAGREG